MISNYNPPKDNSSNSRSQTPLARVSLMFHYLVCM